MKEALLILVPLVLFSIGLQTGFINDIFSDKGIENPTYQEMVDFIDDDYTELREYDDDSFVCHDFTITLLNNAKAQNIRAGYVLLDMTNNDDHAIVCFETTDEGLYFVEPQMDVGFSEAGMTYMIKQGTYSIFEDSDVYAFSGYEIKYWNNDVIKGEYADD
jgi:hypothetical protein